MSKVNKIATLVMAVYVKMKGNSKGEFTMKNFSFEEKGKSFKIENLEISWNYQDSDFSYSEGEFTFAGKHEIQILIENLSIVSPEDEEKFSIDHITLNGMEELKLFRLMLPEGLFK